VLNPPHALPKFLPDRLVCREVAHQIVKGGIGIELKAAQKKSWPIFPVHIGKFSLLNLGHSRVEAEALEEIKLVNIEYKRHDPYQLVNKHLIHCNMKAYEHEESPWDDVFKGTKSYKEVLERVQTLSSDLQVSFRTFQKHRRSGLPQVLQGEEITLPQEQESVPPGFEQESVPPGFEQEAQKKGNPEKALQDAERPPPSKKTKAEKRSGRPPKSGKPTPTSSPKVDVNTPKAAGGKGSMELGSPIASLTPLQSTFGLPQMGALFVDDLTSIPIDEIPPSDYFFSRKRKVVLKQEMHKREGNMVKKNKVLIDGQNLEEEDFATEVAGSMGAMATTNFFTVGKIITRIKKSDKIIAQLREQLKNVEESIREEMSKSLEQTRAAERLEVQSLKTSLDEMSQEIQTNQLQITQQKEHAEQLQARLISMEDQIIDLKSFQAQSLEVHSKIEIEQQKLISKIEIIQNYFQEVDNAFENIILREKEAKAVRITLQKEIIYSTGEEVSETMKVSATEQIRGDIMLKLWETNITESKRIAKEIRDDCEEVFDLLDKGSLNIGKGQCTGLLGQINIVRHQLNFRENLSEIQMEISQLRKIDVTLVDRLLVEPNLKLQSIKFTDKGVDDRLSKIQRKVYLFEARDFPEPPRNFTQFLEKCIKCIESKEGESSTK
jgi:hypothetical protein